MAAVLLIALAVAGCHSVTTSPAPQLPSVPPVQRSASNSPGSGASVPSEPPSLPVARVVGARWPLAGSRRPAGALVFHVPIFTYHRIAEAAEAPDALPGLRVSPEIFDAQLTALVEAGWHSITVAQLALDMEANAPPPARTFVVTIDDGYRDGLTNALPIIRGLGLVATFYVVTGRLGEPSELRPGDLQTLADAGMEIGDHTVRHVNLAHLSGPELEAQIVPAELAIQSIVGRRPATFAYPFSWWNPGVVAAVEAAGFSAAVINRPVGPTDWGNRFLLPRTEVSPATTPAVLVAIASSVAGVPAY